MAKVVILSGAGISAESETTAFRSQDRLLDDNDAQQVLTKETLKQDSTKVIKFYDQSPISLSYYSCILPLKDYFTATSPLREEAEVFIDKLNAYLCNEYIEVRYATYATALNHYEDDETEAVRAWKRVLCKGVNIKDNRPILQTTSGEDIDLLVIDDIRMPYQPLTILQTLQKAEALASDADDYIRVAQAVIARLADQAWAKRILSSAIDKSDDSWELRYLTTSILEIIEDKDLVVQALEKAYATKEDMDDFKELLVIAKDLSDIVTHFPAWLAEYESTCKTTDDHLVLFELHGYGRAKAFNQALDSAEATWECLDILEKME